MSEGALCASAMLTCVMNQPRYSHFRDLGASWQMYARGSLAFFKEEPIWLAGHKAARRYL